VLDEDCGEIADIGLRLSEIGGIRYERVADGNR
jgi:hypothetical protein